jgi:archaeal flagellar protein FlaJ
MDGRVARRVACIALAALGAVASFLAAAAWVILDGPPEAHTALLGGTLLVALAGLLAGRLEGRREESPDLAQRHLARLRTAGVLTRLLTLAVVAALGVLFALEATQPVAYPREAVDRANRVLAAALAAAAAALLGVTLVTRRHAPGSPRLGMALLAGAGVAAAFAAVLRAQGVVALDLPALPGSAAALACAALLGLGMPGARGVPGLGGLLRANVPTARTMGARRTFIPIAVGFALVFVVFLVAILFGVGVGPVVEQVGESPVLAGVAVFIVLLLVGAIAGVFVAGRRSSTQALFRVKADPRKRFERLLLGGSLALALFFLVPAFLQLAGQLPTFPRDAWRHLLCVGVLVALGPYGFYLAREQKRIRILEERFPDFLRDIASSHKGGLTLPGAILVASRGEYGPLTGEVRKMADQLQWNVPFAEALQLFSDRVRTPLVQRAVNLILEANRTGGSTTGLLLAAARDAREIKSLETDRRLSMSLYTVVIYVTFFVFLGVAAILYDQFLPQLAASSQAAQEVAAEGTEVGGITGEAISLTAFQRFYFLAGVLQGIGDGIVAGMMGSGRALLGLQHAFWMVLFAYLTFGFLL